MSWLTKLNPFKSKAQKSKEKVDAAMTKINSLFGTSSLNNNLYRSIFSEPSSILDIDSREIDNNKCLARMVEVQKEKNFLDSMHDKTKDILRLANKIHLNGKLEDLVELDKYVRSSLFNNSFDSFISDDPATQTPKEQS